MVNWGDAIRHDLPLACPAYTSALVSRDPGEWLGNAAAVAAVGGYECRCSDSNEGLMFTLDRLGPEAQDHMLSVRRIAVALIFLEDGTAKFLGIPHVPRFDSLVLFSLGERRAHRARWRHAPRARLIHSARCLHLLRRDGLRLFHFPCAVRLLSSA
jgi:hypothetical protein